MTEAFIDPGLTRDIYVSLGEPLEGNDGAWSVRVYYKPFVSWIWGGAVLMALGGLLAAADRRYRLTAKAPRAPRRAREPPLETLPDPPRRLPRPGRSSSAVGLNRDPREVPSPLVGKPAPEFRLDTLTARASSSRPPTCAARCGCSTCGPRGACRAGPSTRCWWPSPKQGGLPIVGLNYKELRGDGEIDTKKVPAGEELALARQRAGAWLARHGDPYPLSVLDLDGRVGIDYGVYGVPETYLIDKKGMIRFKQIGPITPEALQQKILPLAQQLAAGAPP